MSWLKQGFSWLISLSIIAATVLAIINFRAIDDWIKLRNYQVPLNVSKIAEEDSMTAKAKHIFYVNHPDLISAVSAFQKSCPSYEQTIVLGCYQSNQNGIFIYNVQDSRLNGVVEVTAAHEMLHGAYDRLNNNQKTEVDKLLNDYYQNDLHDQRIIDSINAYRKTEPKDVVNEMHSIFGTEIGNLTPQLESYYQQYFTNRSSVTTFASQYEDEFTSRVNQINAYEQQLNELKQQITSEESSLDAQRSKIDADRARLDNLKSSGQIDEYNAGVASFNAEVDSYNSGVAQLRDDIAKYNSLVDAHNALAAELRSLYSSLDTSLSPQTAQ